MKKNLMITLTLCSLSCISTFAQIIPVEFENTLQAIRVANEDSIFIQSDVDYDIINPGVQTTSLMALSDSVIKWKWDTLTAGWVSFTKTKNYVYDNNNNLTGYLVHKWNGNNWQNYQLYSAIYDVNYNNTYVLYKKWNGSIWEDSIARTYNYDANNNPIYSLTQLWNGSSWDNSTKFTIAYDANNNLTYQLSQLWNGSIWENIQQQIYTYDANSNLTSEYYQNWEDSLWVTPSQKNIYTYDINNNRTSALSQDWNDSVWVNNYIYNNTYDTDNNQIYQLQLDWINGAWENSIQISFSYDGNNNLLSLISEGWNNNSWRNGLQEIYTYDVNNNQTSRLLQDWDNGNWVNEHYYEFTYNSNNDLLHTIFKEWINNAWQDRQQTIIIYNLNYRVINSTTLRWYNNAWNISRIYLADYDENNFRIASSYNDWYYPQYSDSTRFYFHVIEPTCSAGFILYPDTIEHNWLLSATASGVEPISYLWEWGDGTTSTEVSPSHTYDIPGYYNICLSITDGIGCTDYYCDSSTYIFKTDAQMITVNVINHTGIPDEIQKESILIYPNPASSSVTIETEQIKDIYQLHDLTGKLLLRGNVIATKFSLDISALSKGIYLLSLFDGEQEVHRKIVKE